MWNQIRSSRAGMLVFGCVVLALCGGISFPARALDEVLFPYVNAAAMNSTGSPWGAYTSGLFKQIDGSTDNLVWTDDRVFYNSTESWFGSGDALKTWQIYVYNPTGTAYTGSNRIKLYVHTHTGAQADEYTTYDGGTTLIDSTVTGDVEWNSTYNYFLLTVPAYGSLAVTSSNAGALPHLFNNPNPAYGDQFSGGSIRLVPAASGNRFVATLRGNMSEKVRTGTGATWDDRYTWLPFGYNGITSSSFPANQVNKAVLPYFRDKYTTSGSATEWATFVFVTNQSTSSGTLTVHVYNMSGTEVNRTHKSVGPWEKFNFIASQYFSSVTGDMVEGWVVIDNTDSNGYYTSAQPAAVALQMRFPKTASYVNSVLTRDVTDVTIPLLINP